MKLSIEKALSIFGAVAVMAAALVGYGEMRATLKELKEQMAEVKADLKTKADALQYSQESWDKAIWDELQSRTGKR